MCTYTYIYTYIYIDIHTHIYAHTYIYTNLPHARVRAFALYHLDTHYPGNALARCALRSLLSSQPPHPRSPGKSRSVRPL